MPDFKGADRLLNRRVRAYSASDGSTYCEGVAVAVGAGPTLYIVTDSGAAEPWEARLVEDINPGAPDQKRRRAFTGMHFITIDSPEEWSVLEHNDHGAVTGMVANPAMFPSDAWSDALDRVMEDADSASCDLSDLSDEATGQMCSNPVGWVLVEDDEGRPMGSGLEWRQTTLVWTDEGVAVVCEDCSPPVLYAAAADAARTVREEHARRMAQQRAGRAP